jgi:UDP-2,4-diacetamido-2,4,6-trideoxy-beta-L-altropyranose hydrolase
VHRDLPAPELADLMRSCRVAVVSASTVALEAAACGCALVAVQTVANQQLVAEGLRQRGVPVISGDQIGASTLIPAFQQAQIVTGIDGLGATRIAERIHGLRALVMLTAAGCRLRYAAWADAQRLYQWATDPAVRQVSLHQQPITWADHLAWLRRSLLDPQRFLFIVERQGLPVGTCRLDRESGSPSTFTVSLTVDPACRGQGIGAHILDLLARWSAVAVDATHLHAVVRQGNQASLALFAKAGYEQVRSADGLAFFTVTNPC